MSLLNKECTGQRQPLVELAGPPPGLRGPFPFSPPSLSFQGPEPSQEFRLHQTKPSQAPLLRTVRLGSNTMATLSIFDNISFGQSLNHVGLA